MGYKAKTITSGIIWQLLERFGAEIVTFVVSIILARILDPEVYGTIALVTVFTTIMGIFVDSGFCSALIQKKDPDDLDYNTVFYFNLFISIVVYIGMFFGADGIAYFYGKPELVLITRILSLGLIINAFKNCFKAYVTKHMQFKKYFFSTLGGTICAAFVGIILAKKGYGVWALVAQYLTNVFIDGLVLFFTVKWKPKLKFSFSRLKKLFGFGGKLLISSTIETVLDNARSLLIGKKYSNEQLAYYSKGSQFPYILGSNISQSLLAVLFPTFSEVQDSKEEMERYLSNSTSMIMFLVNPIMIGLFVVAEPMILTLLGTKWASAIPFLQLFCIFYAFQCYGTPAISCLKGSGQSGRLVIFTIIKRVIDLGLLVAFMNFGVTYIALSCVLSAIGTYIVNMYISKHYFGYSIRKQIKDFIENLFPALLMGFTVYCFRNLFDNRIICLAFEVILGIVLYFFFAFAFDNKSMKHLIKAIKEKKGK